VKAVARPVGAQRLASDAELLTSVARGDLSALGSLFDRHQARVRRVLVRTGAGSDADDLVQATFLELTRIASRFDGRVSSAAWLCGVALRLAARRRRSLHRLLRNLAAFGRTTPRVDAVDPEREASAQQEMRLFASALEQLTPKKREAFVLVEIEGLSAEDVADALGVPAATVRTRLYYARMELRTTMEEGGAW
jgi:RNA polymerase sigma-70 factor (ECF subfamily)